MSSSSGKKESESARWPGFHAFLNFLIRQNRFSTLFMGLELITMDAEDSDWKEIFRQALLDASRFDLSIFWVITFLVVKRDVADMIIVLDPEYVEKNEVLATISDIRAYGFRFCSWIHNFFTLLFLSWNLITDYERKELLYADHEDPFMSLFSKEKFDEMDQFLVAKVTSINGKSCCEYHIDLIR